MPTTALHGGAAKRRLDAHIAEPRARSDALADRSADPDLWMRAAVRRAGAAARRRRALCPPGRP
jgi:hypothetical protein